MKYLEAMHLLISTQALLRQASLCGRVSTMACWRLYADVRKGEMPVNLGFHS